MATTASSNPNSLYDPIRKEWVAATPEEQVRQHLLSHLIDDLGFPPELLVVERALKELAPGSGAPDRRIDIVAYRREGEGLAPLLLIECKAVALTDAVLHQARGYNHFLKADFICVANQSAICMPWGERQIDYIPEYNSLL